MKTIIVGVPDLYWNLWREKSASEPFSLDPKQGNNIMSKSEKDAVWNSAIAECIKIIEKNKSLVPSHDPDKQGADLVSHGYGNACLNIEQEIRSLERPNDMVLIPKDELGRCWMAEQGEAHCQCENENE